MAWRTQQDLINVGSCAHRLPSLEYRAPPRVLPRESDEQRSEPGGQSAVDPAVRHTSSITLTMLPVEAGVTIEADRQILAAGFRATTVRHCFRPFEHRSADRTGLGLGLEFPGFSGDALGAACEPPQIAPDSAHRDG